MKHRGIPDYQATVNLYSAALPTGYLLLVRRSEVWLAECVVKPGDSIPAVIEEGLELSRVLVLCMSAGKNNIGLTMKRPGVTDIEAETMIALTYYRRTLQQ